MQPTTDPAQCIAQSMAIRVIVIVTEKAGIPIVAPLNVVKRPIRELGAGTAGHEVNPAEIEPGFLMVSRTVRQYEANRQEMLEC
jgi:hypothetical protein